MGLSVLPKDSLTHGQARWELTLQLFKQKSTTLPLLQIMDLFLAHLFVSQILTVLKSLFTEMKLWGNFNK